MGRIKKEIRYPSYMPNGSEHAVVSTSKGDITIELYGLECPVTVGTFVELAKSGFYANLKFHAYKKDHVVLGGCPSTRDLGPEQIRAAIGGILHGVHPGYGDAGFHIVDEFLSNPKNHFIEGSVAMAHKSNPDTASCQFFFSLAKQPELDDEYTVFGCVTEGFDVMHSLRLGDAIIDIRIE